MVRKRVVVGSVCFGLLLAQLFALNSCKASSNEDFQYNLKPRNPMETDDTLMSFPNTNKEMIKIKETVQEKQDTDSFKSSINKKVEQFPSMSCEEKFGIELYKDYNKKFYVTDVIPGSSAQKAGVRIGDIILSIDDEKIKKLNIDEACNIMDRKHRMKLKIKDSQKKNKDIALVKDRVCIPNKVNNDIFDTYWQQIYNGDFDIDFVAQKLNKMSSIPFTRKSRIELQQMERYVSYWLPKKKVFTNGYKACEYSRSNTEQFHQCVDKLVNKELAKISKEEEYAHKRLELATKLQMFAMAAGAVTNLAGSINNHAYALQNQNVYHSGTFNVNHSGTVNVNNNNNIINGYMNIRHFRY